MPEDPGSHRIQIEDAGTGVRVITFDRPEVRNAFDTAMYRDVTAARARPTPTRRSGRSC
jgi:enoyl-CoA hydratase/carnithine racemase